MSSTVESRKHWDQVPSISKSLPKTAIASRWHWPLYIAALLLADIATTATSFRVAYFVRFETALPIFQLEVEPSFDYYTRVVLLTIPWWIILFAVAGLYQRKNLLGGTKEYDLYFQATTLGLLLVIVAGFLEPSLLVARGWLLLAWIITFMVGVMGRFLLRRLVYMLRQSGYFLVPALIIGSNEEGRLLVQQLASWTKSGLQVVGILRTEMLLQEEGMPDRTQLGTLDQLDEIVEQYNIREIILATSALSRKEMLSIFQRYGISNSVNLRLSSGLFEIITTGLQVKEIAYVPLVTVDKVRLKGIGRIMKLGMDYSLALLFILLISPVLLACCDRGKTQLSGAGNSPPDCNGNQWNSVRRL